ncbi:SLBB domain-containing protein [Echinimonas agarilytica]|uniref:SLBB domain-containing protein n=1 Tax=Echinimonas agarilytica TaxID=1215918 RepID=A0AA41W6G5_9GAMM|nr:SLBB domain-containing protein [Echinimonas agarilytica]MCM2679501.1 SLBB domain-containing protein [Echinimonas agarilytica]
MDLLKKYCRGAALLVSLSGIVVSSAVLAANPTPAQMEQFKRLPPAQQQQLAKSYGIDVSQLTGAQSTRIEEPELPPVQAREIPQPSRSDITSEQAIEPELQRFGYSLFAGTPSTFAQVANVPVPTNYLLGPGDIIKVQLFGKTNEQLELQVDRDGNIDFPELGPVSIAGSSFSEARQTIAKRVEEQMIGVRSSITMGELRSIQVFVLGDAYTPGLYTVSALSNISHALYLSGGIAETGSLRRIQLKRNGQLVSELDLYDLLLKGDTTDDARLLPGDVVFIPPSSGSVTIDGEIRRPAIYELKNGETVADAVRMAGGLLPNAYPRKSVLTGYDSRKVQQVVSLDLTKPSALSHQLSGGDYIEVRSAKKGLENGILLMGAAAHPGYHAWSQGMRVSNLLPSFESSVLPSTDLDYALVISEAADGGKVTVQNVNLAKAMSRPNSADDIRLSNKDRVILFNRFNLGASDDSFEGVILADDARFLQALQAQEKSERESSTQHTTQHTMQDKTSSEVIGEASAGKGDRGYRIVENVVVSARSYELLQLHNASPAERRKLLNAAKTFSRGELLSLVIVRLKQQATAGELAKLVQVGGAVKAPGIYPLSEGARLVDMIAAAGGMVESADVNKAEITRLHLINGNEVESLHFSVNIADAYLGPKQSNPLIQPKDVVNVMTVPGWQSNPVVTIRGEVKYPGTYTIKRGETLMDVIARVGGFTQFASVEGAVFTRETIKEREKQQLEQMGEQLRKQLAGIALRTHKGSNVSLLSDYETMQQLIADISATDPVGRLVLDMSAMISGDQSHNVALENGDVLVVPPKRNSVSVIGEVQVETTHFYSAGMSMNDYILRSGGLREQADDERIYVIKANGEVLLPQSGHWFASTDADISPGDTVVVPLNVEYMDNLTLWSTVTGIVYNTAVAIAAISGI